MAYNEFKTDSQVNYGWNLTWEATGKFPIIAKRIFITLADAQGYVDTVTDTATEGLILSVINDADPKNNGAYFVSAIGDGTNPGTLVPVGSGKGVGSTTATTFTEILEMATEENIGQIIYLTEETVVENEDGTQTTYSPAPYIVTGVGSVSKLGTSSADGVDISSDLEALKGRVSTLEDGKVDNTTFEEYQGAVTEALAEKANANEVVDNAAFEEYQGLVSESLAEKANANEVVDNAAFEEYQGAVSETLATKVDTDTYEAKITELESTISLLPKFAIEVVEVLPTEEISETTVYLVKDKDDEGDLYTEYIYVNGAWENLGKQRVDLTNYYNKDEVDTLLEGKVSTEGYIEYTQEEKDKLANVEDGAQVNIIETVSLFGNELNVDGKNVNIDFQSDDVKLGTAITTTNEDGETVEVFGAEKSISQTLQGIYDSLKSGLGDSITSVTGADDSIIVSGDVNNKEVKVQVSAAADNRLVVRTVDGEKGLYVEPLYYDGDDSEVE